MGTLAIRLDQFIAHFIEKAILRLHIDLLIRDRRVRSGAPVNHPLATVNVTPLVQIYKSTQHRLRIILIQGKTRPLPIAGSAQLLQLI